MHIASIAEDPHARLFSPHMAHVRGLPQFVKDDLGANSYSQSREYITFVGPPVPAKGPDIFLKIIDYADKKGLDWHFLLITRSKLTDNPFKGKKNLQIIYSDKLTDEEYGNLINRSLVVLTPYRRETQSSVVLVSYMYGTPVVSSSIGGLPQFVKDDQTGYLVDIHDPIETWVNKIHLIIQDSKRLSVNCRATFVDQFADKNWVKYLPKVLA